MFKFRSEFPDFDAPGDIATVMATDPGGWADQSWRNDSCPSLFHAGRRLQVFVDYANPDLSRMPQDEVPAERITVTDTDADGAPLADGQDAGNFKTAADFAAWFRVDTAARAYVKALADSLTADEWLACRLTNAFAPGYGRDGCDAAHDYCDANDPLAEAFAEVFGRQPFSHADGSAMSSESAEHEGDCIALNAIHARAFDLGLSLYVGEHPPSEADGSGHALSPAEVEGWRDFWSGKHRNQDVTPRGHDLRAGWDRGWAQAFAFGFHFGRAEGFADFNPFVQFSGPWEAYADGWNTMAAEWA